MTDEADQSVNPGREAYLRSMRTVLRRRGLEGDALEARIEQLLRKDVSRIAAVVWGATPDEATNMTLQQRSAFIQSKRDKR